MPSPYLLREEIVSHDDYDLRNLYQSLGLPLSISYGGPAYPIEADECQRRGCDAEVHPITTYAGDDEPTHALVISHSYDSVGRIIFFHEEPRRKGWKLLGHLDAEDHYGIRFHAENPFRLGVRMARGTGISHLDERWYSVDDRGVKKILQVLHYGTDSNVQPMRSFYGFLLSRNKEGEQESLTFLYLVRFSAFPFGVPLFEEHRHVVFTRSLHEDGFRFDAARSDLTQAELGTFFQTADVNRGSVDPSPDKLLGFARTSLLRMARSGNQPQKAWLRSYLAAAPASPIKSELLRTLGAERTK